MTNSAMSPGHGRATIDNTRSPDPGGAGLRSQNPNVAVTSCLALPLGNFKPHPMATWDVLDTLPKRAGELSLHTLGAPT